MPEITTIMIDSRSLIKPQWVQTAIESIAKQSIDVGLIVLENYDRSETIGRRWNEGVRQAESEYCFFLGDDDWISECYLSELLHYIKKSPQYVFVTSNMTAFDEETKLYAPIQRICTGMWRRDYLLKYPFSEKLLKGVDREYLEEVKKRGDLGISIHTNFGYYYRKHDLPSCAGKIIFKKDVSQIYVLPTYRSFIDPLVSKWKKDKTVYVSSEPFDPLLADEAEMIFCEFLSQNAVEVAKYDCKAFKILRLHSYEAFSPLIHYIDFSKFDLVIFVVEHIKEFVESKIGKLENAVVIPVGVKLLPFKEKEKNNKICYAGEISRKKGIGELFILAKELPEYEFHIAGKFKEEDIARWFYFKKPDNVFLEPYSYDLPKFFEDKTYFINTSLREGNPITVLEAMSAGLKPLISDWVGSEIYGEYVFKNLSSLKKLLNEFNPKEYREFAENYDFEKIYPQIEEILERENVISNTN